MYGYSGREETVFLLGYRAQKQKISHIKSRYEAFEKLVPKPIECI